MPEAFTIGPLLLPTRPLGVVLSLLIAVWVSARLAHYARLDVPWVRRVAETAAWLGLLGARLGFVATNWSAFRDEPWTALYFWQPGYSPYTGVLIGAAYVVWRINRRLLAERWAYLRALAGGYVAAALAVAVLLLTSVMIRDPDVLRAGDAVPDFALMTLQGEPVRFSSLQGRGVILNFWATWCPPCRREMPLLDSVHDAYQERGVSIVGVDLSEPPEIVRDFASRMEVDYPIWVDAAPGQAGFDTTGAVYARFGGVGLPTTFFIDAKGVIRKIHVGELNRAILQNQAESLRPR